MKLAIPATQYCAPVLDISRTWVDMNLQDFDKLLRSHDWYYQYSDDHRVYLAGERQHDAIRRASKESPDHLKLFDSWTEYFFSGENWNTPKFTKDQLDAVRSSLGVI
jgi:hypothetical protein